MSDTHTRNDAIISEYADDPDLLDLVERFVEELPRRIAALQLKLNEQDFQSLAGLAHQLKGAAGGYGFSSITDSAAALERSARVPESLDRLAQELQYLADLCRRAKAR